MRRYMITEAECSVAMTPGVIDMLTVVKPQYVEKRGIPWVKNEIKRRCAEASIEYSSAKWEWFWGYFHRTWITKYSIDVWNFCGMDNTLVARTNNPLERLNRELNTRFPTPHPSMATFVSTINQLSTEYAQRLADIPRGRAQRVLREVIQLPIAVELPASVEVEKDTTVTT
ncbi:Hypothetical protein PHPALM_7597 [Phytophthora palmivora]|uniref:Uncharacterized protein n=1 Tax=Phytophthora palmivora TaxID=4796 RepID=A0A2P4YBX6_9STRA|nr:Hypothetical protein PHPALM_7597 [Phytophthora palmivora]